MMNKHIYEVHVAEILKCSKCDFECETQDQLNTHISRIHIKDKHIKCRKCNYEAKTEKELSFHIADDHDIDIIQTGGQNKNNRTRRQTTEFCVFWNCGFCKFPVVAGTKLYKHGWQAIR